MELFDKKFVHFMWDDELEGKECFVSQSIKALIDIVNMNLRYAIVEINKKVAEQWSFFYYDPNYVTKRAYVEGKTIQYLTDNGQWETILSNMELMSHIEQGRQLRVKPEADKFAELKKAFAEGKKIQVALVGTDNKWIDCNEPLWDDECKFRIKPEEPKQKRMTYRQLAEWLAKGNGQYCEDITISLSSKSIGLYYTCADDVEVPVNARICRWNSYAWIEPTVEVYEEGCK